ncbi:MAG: methyltransferase domain-containing protein [Planctomycetes bacterium]|nr:methyltransferase domain-containing protein [Planctomycetota bacterium]
MNRLPILLGLVLAICLLPAGPLSAADKKPDVVYVPTPHDVVDKMLKLAKVTKKDVVYDLGCGDGRIVVTAARKIGCRGIGFEIDPDRIKESNENVKKYDVGQLVQIKNQNIFDTDLSKASVITLYLLPRLNKRLVPQFEKMKPGSRIVSHAYDMPGIKPDKTITVKSREDNTTHKIYLWTIPLKKEEQKKPAEKPL